MWSYRLELKGDIGVEKGVTDYNSIPFEDLIEWCKMATTDEEGIRLD